MAYILLLLIAIGAILSFTIQSNPLAGLVEKTKASLIEHVVPKTQTEVIINNLEPSHKVLERFFSNTAPKVIKSEPISNQERQELQSAIQAFSQSQQAIEQIRQAEQSETSIPEAVIKKILSIEASPTPTPNLFPSPSSSPAPQITPVPPYCHVECS